MLPYRPDRIIVQKVAQADPLTQEILGRLQGLPTSVLEDVDTLLPELFRSSDPRASGKRTLILRRNLGSFMKECPGGGAEICCGYHVINYAMNCPLDCSYCVLQDFLNNPALVVYTNVDDLLNEVKDKAGGEPERVFRIGTGETSDSLVLDHITGYSRKLVPFFATLPNAFLELKTKSDCIENLKSLDHAGRTIVSWSLNPERVIRSEEHKTISLEARLEAASRCLDWDYRIGFHFDPLLHYEGWESDYEELVKRLFEVVDPSRIAWISLGCLRFTPKLRGIVRERFPKSFIPYGEFVPGNHGKLRYFRTIRDEMYSKVRSWIALYGPDVFVYLCMENRAVWERSFPRAPRTAQELSNSMDSLLPAKTSTPGRVRGKYSAS